MSKGEIDNPISPPPKEYPADWNPKSCPVWLYKPQPITPLDAKPEILEAEMPNAVAQEESAGSLLAH